MINLWTYALVNCSDSSFSSYAISLIFTSTEISYIFMFWNCLNLHLSVYCLIYLLEVLQVRLMNLNRIVVTLHIKHMYL